MGSAKNISFTNVLGKIPYRSIFLNLVHQYLSLKWWQLCPLTLILKLKSDSMSLTFPCTLSQSSNAVCDNDQQYPTRQEQKMIPQRMSQVISFPHVSQENRVLHLDLLINFTCHCSFHGPNLFCMMNHVAESTNSNPWPAVIPPWQDICQQPSFGTRCNRTIWMSQTPNGPRGCCWPDMAPPGVCQSCDGCRSPRNDASGCNV